MQKIKYGKEGRFVEGTSNFRIDSLKQHDTSNSHTEAYKRFRAEKMRETSSTAQVRLRLTMQSTQETANCPGWGLTIVCRGLLGL